MRSFGDAFLLQSSSAGKLLPVSLLAAPGDQFRWRAAFALGSAGPITKGAFSRKRVRSPILGTVQMRALAVSLRTRGKFSGARAYATQC